MKPMFVEPSVLRDARNFWDVACVTLGKNCHLKSDDFCSVNEISLK